MVGGIEIDMGQNGSKTLRFPNIGYDDLELSKLSYEKTLTVASRTWRIVVHPIDDSYDADVGFIILSGSMIFIASLLLAVWMVHNSQKSLEMHRVVTKAAAEAAIVTNLFPKNVRDRMLEDALAGSNHVTQGRNKDAFLNTGKQFSSTKINPKLSSEGIFGSKPIAELHPYTTVM